MDLPFQIAKHTRDTWFGGNWTAVNLKETLKEVTWQQATTKVYSLHTIAELVYHINYFVGAVLKVPELMAIFAVVAISCATIKYWITPAVTEAPP